MLWHVREMLWNVLGTLMKCSGLPWSVREMSWDVGGMPWDRITKQLKTKQGQSSSCFTGPRLTREDSTKGTKSPGF